MTKNKKNIIILLILAITLNSTIGCTNAGSSASTSPADSGSDEASTVTVPGIGTGGSIYIFGTLDGEWTTGCEGGGDGDNWSYITTMTVSGNYVVKNEDWFRNNQTCAGSPDVNRLDSFTMNWSSYDTTGYSENATYTNRSTLITVLTANGMARMSNEGSCTPSNYILNSAVECANVLSGTAKYYLADNIFLPEDDGPASHSQVGIVYAFGTFRKVVSNSSAIDGIYAIYDGSVLNKLIVSGDRYAYIIGRELFHNDIYIVSGSLLSGSVVTQPAGASKFLMTIKSKILQPRSVFGVSELNNATICGHSDYSNGTVKNLLLSGLCTSSDQTNFVYKLTGNTLQYEFRNLNLPLPTTLPTSPVLKSPWKYSIEF